MISSERVEKFFHRGNSRTAKFIPLPRRDQDLMHMLVLERRKEKGTFNIFKPYDIYVARLTLELQEGKPHPVPQRETFTVVSGGEFLSERAAEKVFRKKAEQLRVLEEQYVA